MRWPIRTWFQYIFVTELIVTTMMRKQYSAGFHLLFTVIGVAVINRWHFNIINETYESLKAKGVVSIIVL